MSVAKRRPSKNFTLAALALVAAGGVIAVRGRTGADGIGPGAAGSQTAVSMIGGRARDGAEVMASRPTDDNVFAKITDEYFGYGSEGPVAMTELAALYWCANQAPDIEIGRRALGRLNSLVSTVDLEELGDAIDLTQAAPNRMLRPIASGLLRRIEREPDHPRAAQLLATVCAMTCADRDAAEPSSVFVRAADLIAARHAKRREIGGFIDCLAPQGVSPRWSGGFEDHLQAIQGASPHPEIQCRALFARACIARMTKGAGSESVASLFQQLVDTFDRPQLADLGTSEKELLRLANVALEEPETGVIGKPAPEIVGVDVDGRPRRLSEFRGKVVLLSFWATWCFPCMKFLPVERAIADRLEGKPFAIVGINGDGDDRTVREAIARHEITWTSFRDRLPGENSISSDWDVLGWPTLYLIDHQGIVRERWVERPSENELNLAIDELVRAVN